MAPTCLHVLITLTIFLVSTYAQSGPQIPFSAAEKQQILDLHNQLRFAVNAQTMPALVWDEDINLWPTNPNNCAFDHTDQTFRSNKGGFSYIGENLAFSGANTDITTFMSGWASEKSLFVYGPITLNNYGVVGHYTQEMWSATTSIGCSKFNCTATSPSGFLFVCNYGPGGNYLNQYPYLLCTSPPCASAGGSTPSSSSAASLSNTNTMTATATASTAPSNSNTPSRSTAASLSPSQTNAPSTSTTATPSRTSVASGTSTASRSVSPSPSPAPVCVPSTCSAGRCGNAPDGCGGALSCGSCSPSTSHCGSNFQCVACTPTTTCSGKQCGTINDGCGNTVSCGSCSSGSTCNNNTCVVTPVCNTCAQLSVECGTITPTGCPKLDCGICSSGFTCSYGNCTPTPCVPSCGNQATCVGGNCTCYTGYSDKGDGNGCTPIPTTPSEFSESYPIPVSTNNWVYSPTDSASSSPELDMIATDDTVFHKLQWNNANQYASLELTKFTAQVKIFSASTIVGLGLRYGQGTNRDTDAIQYQVEPVADGSGNVRWNLIWSNTKLDYQIQGNDPTFGLNSWHSLQLNLWNANYSSVTWAVSEVYIDGTLITRQLAVRPYSIIGGAYLYTQGQSSWKNITMATTTTLRVSVANCLSSSAWAQMVANALGIPISQVTIVNVTDSTGRCVGQSTGRRQAASGSEFIFTLESVPDATSQALASQFTAYAEEWNPYFADAGGINSVEIMPAEYIGTVTGNEADVAQFLDFQKNDPLAAAAGGGGLGGGAIAGIVIGSVVGGVIVIGLIAAIVIVAAIVISKRNSLHREVDKSAVTTTSKPTQSHDDVGTPVSTPGRKGVDVYAQGDPSANRKSLTGRIPSGYTPRAEQHVDVDNDNNL